MPEVVKLWREASSATSKKLGQSLADPDKYGNLFPEFVQSLELEAFQRTVGYELSSNVENLPDNWRECNIDRLLEDEKAEAERRGLVPPAPAPPSTHAPPAQTSNISAEATASEPLPSSAAAVPAPALEPSPESASAVAPTSAPTEPTPPALSKKRKDSMDSMEELEREIDDIILDNNVDTTDLSDEPDWME